MEDGNGSETQVNFNRFATIGDMAGDDYDRACQIVCYEPNNSTGAINQSGNSKVWYILFVSKDKLKFYNGATNASNKIETKTIANNTDKNYLNRLLNEGYNSQNDIHIAKHFASTIVSDNFNGLLRRNLSFNTGRSEWSLTNLCSCSIYSPSYDSRYDYYGVFVYYGIGTSGQGRVMYKIVRKLREVPVTVNFKKTDMDGTSISGAVSGAEIKIEITREDNAKPFSSSDGPTLEKKIYIGGINGEKEIEVAPDDYSKGWFKLNITEETAPTSHAKFNGTITVTVNYNTSNGTVTSITSDNTTYIDISSNTVTIKNQYISPIVIGGDNGGFNKVDQAGNPISGARFKAVFTQGGSPIATKYANSAESGKLSFAQVQPTTTANVTVTITEESAPTGYVKSNFSKTIEFKYNTDTKTWEPVNDSTVSVKYESEKTFVKLGDVENKSRIEKLVVVKSDSQKGTKKLSGAKFKITLENVEEFEYNSRKYSSPSGSSTTNFETNSYGQILFQYIVIKDVTQDVIITIEETEAPVGYKKINGTITIKLHREGDSYVMKKFKDDTVLDLEFNATQLSGIASGDVNGDGKVDTSDVLSVLYYIAGSNPSNFNKAEADVNGDGDITEEDANFITKSIYIANLPPKTLEYFKNIEKGLKGDVTGDGKVSAEDSLKILKHATGIEFLPEGKKTQADINGDDKINSTDAVLILQYYSWRGSETINDHVIELNINNIPNIQELDLNKVDSQDETKVAGAVFEVNFENVVSVGAQDADKDGNLTITKTTDSNGDFEGKIENIEIKDLTEPIVITIKEIQAPVGYKKIDGTITIEIEFNTTTGYSIKEKTISKEIKQDECNKGNVKIENNKVILDIGNIPIMNLGGIVWKDGQTGVKGAVAGPNGKKDEGEEGLAGVIVELYKGNEQITEDAYGNKLVNITDGNGNYKFENIERGTDYHIVFKYDGINYQETKGVGVTGTDSKATEVGRSDFNDNFKKISKDKSNANIPLGYEYENENEKSILKVNIDGTNPANSNAPDFQMVAKSGMYLENASDWRQTWTNPNYAALHVDCGLVKKVFDLALGTDVKEAEVSINDKTTTYNYAQIMNGELADLNLDKILENKSSDNTYYNLYLYQSDYNYRIDDYKTDADAIPIPNTVNPGDPEDGYKENEGDENTDRLKELEVYVTYSVILKNQTTYDATVNKFVYYYDEVYTPMIEEEKVVNGYKVTSIDDNNHKMTFEVEKDNKLTDPNYRVEVELKFKVNSDENGIVAIKDNCTNVAEITEYSTDEGGLIDKDSAPDNGITNGEITQYEDDTDQAKGINISIKEDNPRTITGTVWNDGKFNDADGLKNEDTPVNDVIVQLIEIKKISGEYYEYIWQETRSGSNKVKTTSRNGYAGNGYEVYNQDGQYQFKDFIPGNYIIRFIYGDGSTYDLTDNVKEYNGQDYKSTKDLLYQKTWYNNVMYNSTKTEEPIKYDPNSSVARDNEARRLEVMSYSTTIDKVIGESLEKREKADLENTWMCAETSRIYIAVDTDNLESTGGTQTATESGQGITFSNVNFGLALRPQTKLELEKHITGLKITPNGVGVQPIIDATADIGAILSGGETVATSGITTGLAAMKSDRDNRNFWKVETDIEELAQGAQLEVEYTYVIKNVGDEDYLSEELINKYESKYENYAIYLAAYDEESNELIGGFAKTVKDTMRNGNYSYKMNPVIGNYLSKWYYTGEDPDENGSVLSRVEKLQEALNNDLKFENTDSDDFNVKESSANKMVYNTTGVASEKEINTIVEIENPSAILKKNENDHEKTIKLTTVLSSSSGGELGANLPSYIAEIVEYSNAAGRRDMESEPENLSYVHSDDPSMTLETYTYQKDDGTVEDGTAVPEGATIIREKNEPDEFWGESIIITKPTGENKQAGIQIAIITTSAVALLGVGIVLIKKFVLKK